MRVMTTHLQIHIMYNTIYTYIYSMLRQATSAAHFVIDDVIGLPVFARVAAGACRSCLTRWTGTRSVHDELMCHIYTLTVYTRRVAKRECGDHNVKPFYSEVWSLLRNASTARTASRQFADSRWTWAFFLFMCSLALARCILLRVVCASKMSRSCVAQTMPTSRRCCERTDGSIKFTFCFVHGDSSSTRVSVI